MIDILEVSFLFTLVGVCVSFVDGRFVEFRVGIIETYIWGILIRV